MTVRAACGKRRSCHAALILPALVLCLFLLWSLPAEAHSSGLVNGDFETGDLTGWEKSYKGAQPQTGAVWEVTVAPQYAHSGKYGCRLYNANNYWWSNVYLKQEFRDESPQYTIWMNLAGGGQTKYSGVTVSFTDLDSGKSISYRGNAYGSAYMGTGADRIHHYFKMKPGLWEAYHFNFAEDYKAEYGVYPGPHRLIVIRAYQDTDFCDVYVDDIAGVGVEPVQVQPSGVVLIDDPSFVTLTAIPVSTSGENTAFKLCIKANNPALPVEVSYLVTDSSGTPNSPTEGVQVHPDGETGADLLPGKQHFFHFEVGGWAKPQFQANPQYLPLPHYRTCILMLARYEKVYVVFLRENDRQLTYKVLRGGPFTGLDVPGLGKVTRQGGKFEIRSYGGPVEVGLWAKGQYLHDEVAGWAKPEYAANPKHYDIPHYGMFMLMIARYGKIGLIIGNENDGKLGTVCLTGSHLWNVETVQNLCTVQGLLGPEIKVKATTSDPVEVSHFAFDNTCWQWEVNGWAKPEFAPNPQNFRLKHYTPGLVMCSRYGKAAIFFYNENDGQLGVLRADQLVPSSPPGGVQTPTQPQTCQAQFRIGILTYEVGEKVETMDVAPYVTNGRTYLPLRYLAYACGVAPENVTWDGETRTVTLKKGETILRLRVDSQVLSIKKISAGGTETQHLQKMNVAPEIKNGRVMLPARYVAEGFGFQVQWDPQTKAIVIR